MEDRLDSLGRPTAVQVEVKVLTATLLLEEALGVVMSTPVEVTITLQAQDMVAVARGTMGAVMEAGATNQISRKIILRLKDKEINESLLKKIIYKNDLVKLI